MTRRDHRADRRISGGILIVSLTGFIRAVFHLSLLEAFGIGVGCAIVLGFLAAGFAELRPREVPPDMTEMVLDARLNGGWQLYRFHPLWCDAGIPHVHMIRRHAEPGNRKMIIDRDEDGHPRTGVY